MRLYHGVDQSAFVHVEVATGIPMDTQEVSPGARPCNSLRWCDDAVGHALWRGRASQIVLRVETDLMDDGQVLTENNGFEAMARARDASQVQARRPTGGRGQASIRPARGSRRVRLGCRCAGQRIELQTYPMAGWAALQSPGQNASVAVATDYSHAVMSPSSGVLQIMAARRNRAVRLASSGGVWLAIRSWQKGCGRCRAVFLAP